MVIKKEAFYFDSSIEMMLLNVEKNVNVTP